MPYLHAIFKDGICRLKANGDVNTHLMAFDLGGVIFQANNDTNIFSANYLETPIQPEMFHILEELSKNKYNKLIRRILLMLKRVKKS
jgi:hypothetical protein